MEKNFKHRVVLVYLKKRQRDTPRVCPEGLCGFHGHDNYVHQRRCIFSRFSLERQQSV